MAGRKPGGLKTGGRKPGTPNKATQDLMAICQKHGVDVFEAMVMLAVKEIDPGKQFDRYKEIAQYLYPKRKAIELANDAESEGFIVKIVDYGSKK